MVWLREKIGVMNAFEALPSRIRRGLSGLTALPSDDRGVALALGGGGVRGFAHLGFLRVLEEEGVPVRGLAGTSAGALASCVYAFGLPLRPEPVLEALESLGQLLSRGGMLSRWRWILSISRRPALVDDDDFVSGIAGLLGERRLEESRVPVAVVTADLRSGDVVVLREGPAARAVAASCAIPGVFPPFEQDGRLLVDGAVADKVPVSAARSVGGGGPVIGVDVSNPVPPSVAPRNGVEAAIMAGDASRRRLTQISLQEADLAVRLPLERQVERFEMQEAERLYRLGMEVGEEQLPEIKRLLDRNGVDSMVRKTYARLAFRT